MNNVIPGADRGVPPPSTNEALLCRNEIPVSTTAGVNVGLADVHAMPERRGVPINRVGVTNVAFPLVINQKGGGEQIVNAKLSMYGALPPEVKGTNMSRFVEVLLSNFQAKPISGDSFKGLLETLGDKLGTNDVYISASFEYFVPKKSPATDREHISCHKCRFIGQLRGGVYSFTTETDVYVASYCPCSREMCLVDAEKQIGKGAHAQRGLIQLQVQTTPAQPGMWLEDQIRICETSGSAELYPLLKRLDEKYVTIQGYDNPKYVEDIARDVMVKIKKLSDISWAHVKVRNEESIHPHDVEAVIELTKIEDSDEWVMSNRGRK